MLRQRKEKVNMENKTKNEGSWGYRESIIVGITLLLLGIVLQILLGKSVELSLQWPFNLITFVVHIVICVMGFVLFKSTKPIRWITRIPASMVSIVMVLFFDHAYWDDSSSSRTRGNLYYAVGFE